MKRHHSTLSKTRHFNGHVYHLDRSTSKKTNAKHRAQSLREAGHKARVAKVGKRYRVYKMG